MSAKKLTAYTTRKMPKDFLDRMRVLAAMRSADEGHRVTLEAVVNEVIKRGLVLVEKDVLK